MKRRFLSLFSRFFEKSFRSPLSQSLTALPALPKGEPIAARPSAAFTAQKPAQSSRFPCRCVGSPPRGSCRANARLRGRTPTKKRPHHSKEQWGRFTILQWVPLIQPWGLREPLPPQPLRRALPERQERQRASEPASPRAWGDSDRPSAGRG